MHQSCRSGRPRGDAAVNHPSVKSWLPNDAFGDSERRHRYMSVAARIAYQCCVATAWRSYVRRCRLDSDHTKQQKRAKMDERE